MHTSNERLDIVNTIEKIIDKEFIVKSNRSSTIKDTSIPLSPQTEFSKNNLKDIDLMSLKVSLGNNSKENK